MSNNRRRLRRSWADDPSGQLSLDLGFGRYQQQERNRIWDGNRPRAQILTPREPPPQQRRKICLKCDNTLTWLEQPQRKYICYSCGVLYSKDFEKLPSSNDQSIKPLQSVDPFEQIQPAFISKKRNSQLEGEYTNTHTEISGSYRRARIKTDNPAGITESYLKSYFMGEGVIE